MILNLKSLSFTKPENVKEKYTLIVDEFQKLGQPFTDFLKYFNNTWMGSSALYPVGIWNYSLGVDIKEIKIFIFTLIKFIILDYKQTK